MCEIRVDRKPEKQNAHMLQYCHILYLKYISFEDRKLGISNTPNEDFILSNMFLYVIFNVYFFKTQTCFLRTEFLIT